MIPFNKPFIAGNELQYIRQAVENGKISGNGEFTERCHQFFKEKFGFKKVLLTHSCTAALEMAAILIDVQKDDEIIMPSFTFVSTANAFVLRGAKIVFADSGADEPNIDAGLIEELITKKTKAIVVTHYGGIAADMEKIMKIANDHKLFVIEDAAQAIGSKFNQRYLGGIGHLAAFSFHETKNIISGEGGMLVINDEKFNERAEIIWEKGTDRSKFFRGEIEKYNWVDIGSSFLPSEIMAAYLLGQLEHYDEIQGRRKMLWEEYQKLFKEQHIFSLLNIPSYANHNYHLFAVLFKSETWRKILLSYMVHNGYMAVFHYQSLHKSPFFLGKHDGRDLPNSDRFSGLLLRLPLFHELKTEEVRKISETALSFYG